MDSDNIQRASDIIDIQALKAAYCESIDHCGKQPEELATRLGPLLTEEVDGDLGVGPLRGRDAVLAFLSESVLATSEWTFHVIHSPRIEVNGNDAVGHWTALTRMKAKGVAVYSESLGRYNDRFTRTNDGWRICALQYDMRD